MSKIALRFGCAKQSKNHERYLLFTPYCYAVCMACTILRHNSAKIPNLKCNFFQPITAQPDNLGTFRLRDKKIGGYISDSSNTK